MRTCHDLCISFFHFLRQGMRKAAQGGQHGAAHAERIFPPGLQLKIFIACPSDQGISGLFKSHVLLLCLPLRVIFGAIILLCEGTCFNLHYSLFLPLFFQILPKGDGWIPQSPYLAFR